MKLIGLTGSIAMGKSTTAQLFREAGIAVFDADQVVHELYEKGGAAVKPVSEIFPAALVDNHIDRNRLSALVLGNQAKIAQLEALIHPLVRREQHKFVQQAHARGEQLVILDIPLLFETKHCDDVDAIIVVSASAEIQKTRALQRPDMTEEKFSAILDRQIPDVEKCAQADYIIDSSNGIESARQQVATILSELMAVK